MVWVVMVYQRLPAGALEAATERSSQELRELDGVIAQLEAENAQLSALVEERTLGLEAANQSLTRFSASLSHDLRAPLRSIAGFTKVLAESKIPDAARNQIAGLMADTESLQLLLEKTMINLRRETGQ